MSVKATTLVTEAVVALQRVDILLTGRVPHDSEPGSCLQAMAERRRAIRAQLLEVDRRLHTLRDLYNE